MSLKFLQALSFTEKLSEIYPHNSIRVRNDEGRRAPPWNVGEWEKDGSRLPQMEVWIGVQWDFFPLLTQESHTVSSPVTERARVKCLQTVNPLLLASQLIQCTEREISISNLIKFWLTTSPTVLLIYTRYPKTEMLKIF